jgi:hypothetical protein
MDAGDGSTGIDADVSSALIRAAEGGTVAASDGIFSLIVPPGALAEDTVIEVRVLPRAEYPAALVDSTLPTEVYRVEPDGLQFSLPATAEYRYPSLPAWAGEGETYVFPMALALQGDGRTLTVPAAVHFSHLADGTYTVRAEVRHLSDHFVVEGRSNFGTSFGDDPHPLLTPWSGRVSGDGNFARGDIESGAYWVKSFPGRNGRVVALSFDESVMEADGGERLDVPFPDDFTVRPRWSCDVPGTDVLRVDTGFDLFVHEGLWNCFYNASLIEGGFLTGVQAHRFIFDIPPDHYVVSATLEGEVVCAHRLVGEACASPDECETGFCIDGYCCTETCTGVCRACDWPGYLGMCIDVPAYSTDGDHDPPCEGDYACDGGGACLLKDGESCTASSECISRQCPVTDGVCCENACEGTCETCTGSVLGMCLYVPAGMTDPMTCEAPNECDVDGNCVPPPPGMPGDPCDPDGDGSDCETGFCVDGTCCLSASCGVCRSCDQPFAGGTCQLVPGGTSDDTCPDPRACDAAGRCLAATGELCGATGFAGPTGCRSGFCADGYCCDRACTAVCEDCDVTPGTCGPTPDGMTDTLCTSERRCFGGVCLRIDGASCTLGSECRSGNCVDNVCCATPSCPACQDCRADAPASGTCWDVSGSYDPPDCASPTMCVGTFPRTCM